MRLLILAAAGRRKAGLGIWATESADIERRLFSLVNMNNRLYAYGGIVAGGSITHRLTEYEHNRKSWVEKSSSAGVVSLLGRQRHAAAAVGATMYVSGGRSGSSGTNTLYAYDSITDTWSVKQGTTAVEDHTLVNIDDMLYLFGGINTANTAQSSCRLYDPVMNTWTARAAAPLALKDHTAVVFDGKMYVYGGSITSPTIAVSKFLMYDPVSNLWTTLSDGPVRRMKHGAAVIGSKMYIAGGLTETGAVSKEVHVYDFITGEWQQIPDAPATKLSQKAGKINETLYLLGSDGAVGEPNALWSFGTI